MKYTIKQLAKLAHVTVRTLHHYDAIGLLSPQRDPDNGYRMYSENDMLLLQQILFFRELDFDLEEIKRIIYAPDFDIRLALTQHKNLLKLKRKRITRLIYTIDNNLDSMQNNQSADQMYNPFDDADIKKYQSEAKFRWGHTKEYAESMKRVKQMTKAQMDQLKIDAKKFNDDVVAIIEFGPESDEAQEKIAQHYNNLRTFYEPNLELYAGLAQMYIADPRFAAYYNAHHPDLAQFMHDAMMVYIQRQS